ncbi:hypothetical protein GSI_08204 [Ganoderma sinense ZZ0214-1]|uniref:Uncharacterized protein n=1 Tax=Ganoderma sinense ZZ0214-1 TaxID=1077348 RepID=A0A2G8S7P1_9APHY|nr:hypothetical protein GSI_08204 [Ganoderma sinense ZZ0214-1]
MDDYFLHESQWPDKRARLELARRVNAVLQCSCYSAQHVYMRFVHLRRRQDPAVEKESENSLLTRRCREDAEMSLRVEEATRSDSVVAKLDVLLEEEPGPTPEVAAIWADVLSEGVMAEDIITYALLRQAKRHLAESEMGCKVARAASPARPSSSGSTSTEPRVVERRVPASSRPLTWRTLQTEPSSDPERTRKRRAPPQLTSSSSPSACSQATLSSGDASCLDLKSSSSSSSSVDFPSPAIQGQEVAMLLRHALSAPTGPRPKTFLELSSWLRGSQAVSVTAI